MPVKVISYTDHNGLNRTEAFHFDNDPPSLYPTLANSFYMNGIFNTDEIRNIYSRTADAISIPYYGRNEECVNVYGKLKKKLTIYDLNQLIFPFDPIRDWVEKKTKEINEKYAWAEEL